MMLEEEAWNEFKSKVSSESSGVRVMINGEYLTVDAFIKKDMVYAPVRIIAEAMGAEVQWDDSSRTVLITTRGSGAGNELSLR